MPWKAYFFVNPNKTQEQETITYGFKSRHQPPWRTEFKEFEIDVFNKVKLIKFRSISGNFQKKLKSYILKIKKSNNIFADKTNNIYQMHPKDNQKPIKNSITKTYKKVPRKLEKSLETKNITKNINLADQTEHLPRSESLSTLRNHKNNFTNKPK